MVDVVVCGGVVVVVVDGVVDVVDVVVLEAKGSTGRRPTAVRGLTAASWGSTVVDGTATLVEVVPFDAAGSLTDARLKEPTRTPLGGAIMDSTAGPAVPFVSAYVGLLPAPWRRTAPPVNPMRNTKTHRTAAWPMGTRLGGAVMRRSRRTSCPQHCSSNRDRPAVRGGGRGHAPSSAGAKRSLGGTGCRGTAYTVVAAPVKHRSQNLGYPTSGTANAIGRTLLRTGAIGSGRSGCPPSRRPGAGRWPKLGSRGQRREASRWPLRRRSPSRAATWRLPRG
jgi:hypothetical protein